MKSLSVLGAIVLALLVGFAGEATAQVRFIVNQLSGRCLDVVGAPGTQNGARIVLYDCEFSGQSANLAQTDQLWEFLPTGFIRNIVSGRCLDVRGGPGTQNGAPLVLYDCELSGRSANGAQTDQQWQVMPSGLIRNILSGRCIDVSGGPGRNNGTPIVLFDCEVGQRNSDQYWRRQ